MHIWTIPWSEVLSFQHPFEIMLRGTLCYFGLLAILRIILKRQTGAIAPTDLLVTVLIADAIQNGMAGDYITVPDGLLLVTTIALCDYSINLLAFHFKAIDRLINSPPLLLIKDGKLQRRNMRKEFITVEELEQKIREEGVDNFSDVKASYLENNGEISVIKRAT